MGLGAPVTHALRHRVPSVENETSLGIELRSGTSWVRAISNTELSASVSLTGTYGSCSFASVNWNFPATFVGTLPKIDGSAYVTGRIVTVAPAAAQQLYSSSMYVVDLSINGSTVSVLLKYLAVGRWF